MLLIWFGHLSGICFRWCCFSKVWKFPDLQWRVLWHPWRTIHDQKCLAKSTNGCVWKKGSPEQLTVHHHSPCKIRRCLGRTTFSDPNIISHLKSSYFLRWNPHVWWLTAAHVTIWERYALAGREFCAGGLPAARHSVHDRMIEWIELYETNQLVGDIRDPSTFLRCISDMIYEANYLPGQCLDP